MKNKEKFRKGGCGTAIILVLILFCAALLTVSIKPGYAGIVYNRGTGLESKVLKDGWKVVWPWKKVIKYPVSTETIYMTADKREGSKDDDSFELPTKGGKQVRVGVSFNYHYDIERLPEVFSKFRGRSTKAIEAEFIRGNLKAWPGEITGKYQPMDLYGEKRAEARNEVKKLLNNNFSKWGIIVDDFNFTEIIPDKDTMAAIQKVVNDRQALEQEKLKNEKVKIEQQRLATEAKNKEIQAKGEANATALKAKGEADANTIISKSITKELIEYKKALKWDGVTPKVMGSGTSTILDMRESK